MTPILLFILLVESSLGLTTPQRSLHSSWETAQFRHHGDASTGRSSTTRTIRRPLLLDDKTKFETTQLLARRTRKTQENNNVPGAASTTCTVIRSACRNRRMHCHLVASIAPPSSPLENQKTLERLVPQFGLKYKDDDDEDGDDDDDDVQEFQSYYSTFRRIPREKARTVVENILHRDLAYDTVLMSRETAEGLAQLFLSEFNETTAHYFHNGCEFDQKNGYSLRGWNSATDATFDAGIVVLDKSMAGCLWVEDED